ncbi:hypothetical protein [Bacillus sp. FJAT-52991]|uniref:Uncharacterized protein n=1 Tax=Bacillus kandeliae TaxID=3129297 RepID=A0ABZ2N216_9BACI
MKFIIEVGQLESYTIIYTSNIGDWSNTTEVLNSMNALFSKEECREAIPELK